MTRGPAQDVWLLPVKIWPSWVNHNCQHPPTWFKTAHLRPCPRLSGPGHCCLLAGSIPIVILYLPPADAAMAGFAAPFDILINHRLPSMTDLRYKKPDQPNIMRDFGLLQPSATCPIPPFHQDCDFGCLIEYENFFVTGRHWQVRHTVFGCRVNSHQYWISLAPQLITWGINMLLATF